MLIKRPAAGELPGTHAFIVGVSAYPFADGPHPTETGTNARIANLTCAARSASEVAAWLLGEYHNPDAPLASLWILLSPVDGEQINPDVSVLMGEDAAPATRSAVETDFEKFRRYCRSNTDNVAFVYIAGHGWQLTSPGAIVLLHDFAIEDQDDPLYGAIDVVECRKRMDEGGNAHHQVWFSDACRTRAEIVYDYEKLDGPYFPRMKKDGAVASSALILSASERETAWGQTGATTIFCQALLAAFRGEAGKKFDPAAKPPSAECDQWQVPVTALQPYLQLKTKELLAGREVDLSVDIDGRPREFVLHRFTPTRRAEVLQTIPPGPPINAIAWDPDGRRLAIATNRDTVNVVATNRDTISAENIDDRQVKESLVIHDRGGDFPERCIVDVAFSRRGDRLATAISYPYHSAGSTVQDQGAVKLWDTANGELLLEIGSRVAATKVAFSPDGARLATAGLDKRAYLWNVGEASGKPLRHFSHGGAVTAVEFNVDGTRLATASADATARIWDVADGSRVHLLRHDAEVTAVAFNVDGTRLATASADGTARIWDVADGSQLKLPLLRHDTDKEVTAVSFDKDGTRLATGSVDHTARIWDVAHGRQLEKLDHEDAVSAVAFSPNGKQLATVSADHRARIWDVAGL